MNQKTGEKQKQGHKSGHMKMDIYPMLQLDFTIGRSSCASRHAAARKIWYDHWRLYQTLRNIAAVYFNFTEQALLLMLRSSCHRDVQYHRANETSNKMAQILQRLKHLCETHLNRCTVEALSLH